MGDIHARQKHNLMHIYVIMCYSMSTEKWVQKSQAMRETWERKRGATSHRTIIIKERPTSHITNWDDVRDLREKLKNRHRCRFVIFLYISTICD